MPDDLIGPGEQASRRVRAACYDALVEVARLRAEDLPGITEALLDQIVMAVVQGRGSRLGLFSPDCWSDAGSIFSEVALNLNRELSDRGTSLAEDLLTTLIHELVHAYAHYVGVKDTSNRGRYHSMKFGRFAFALGLSIVPTGTYRGLSTPGLTQEARELFADVLQDLERQVTMQPHYLFAEITPVGDGDEDEEAEASTLTAHVEETNSAPYVSATCGCTTDGRRPRRIRVARGSWDIGAIICGICRQAFVSESLTSHGQDGQGRASAPRSTELFAQESPADSTFDRKEAIIQR